MPRVLGILASITIAAAAHGQAINIDFGAGGSFPVPAPTFAAAGGQPGIWNGLRNVSNTPAPLVDIAGAPVAAAVTSFPCIEQGYQFGNTPGFDADHIALLDSAWYSQQLDGQYNGVVYAYVQGLTNGSYTVYTYSYLSFDTAQQRTVSCNPSVEGGLPIAGAAPANTFVQGVTHTVHHVTLTNGTLVIAVYPAANYSDGYLNGVQIVPDGGLPTCTINQAPASHSAVTGTTTTFSASISGDVRSYRWTKDGVDLTDTRGITGSGTSTLTMTQVRDNDAGSYALRYTCGGSVLTTAGATLSVLPACGTADFNADGDIGTDADIEAFFRVLAGENC